MGTSSSNPFQEGGELLGQYTVTSKNPQTFLTYLTHKKTEKEYVMRQLTYTEQRQYTIHSQKAKNRKNIKNKHVTHLQRIQQRSQDNMCSTFFKMFTLWEYSSRSLFDEIKQRALQRKPFENVQLWSILAGSVMGLAAFQEKDIRHECLTTKAILTESDGNVKIVDPMAVGLPTNFESIFNNRTLKNIYLSPQQCQAVQSQKPIINKNAFKNDVFSIAMILLQCGLLERQDQCYLDDCSRINWSKIQANLNRFGQIYQQSLKQILIVMLSKDIRSRPDWLDLDGFVKKNSNTSSKVPTYDREQRKTQFIRRTVQNSLPNKNKVSQSNNNATPIHNQPNFSKFYGQAPPQHLTQNVNPLTSYSEVKQVLYSSPRDNITNKINQPNFNYFSNHEHSSAYSIDGANSNNHAINFKPVDIMSAQNNQNIMKSTHIPTYDLYSYPKITQPSVQNPVLSMNAHYSANPTQYQYFSASQKEMLSFQLQKNYASNSVYSPAHQIVSIESKHLDNPSMVQPNKVTDINSFSPINFSQYVRPAHSVDYQVIKANSPIEGRKEGKVQANTVPFDPKIPQSPQILQSNSIQQSSQSQFVVEHFKMGSRYQGYKQNGQRHGRGKFFYQDGGCYDGQWRNNKMEGFGILYYQNDNKAYEGMWVNDQFQGKGKLFNECPVKFNQFYDFNSFDDIDQYWQYYEGDFTQDEKDGNGCLKFSNGQFFEGTFKKDMVQGEGTFYCLDDRKFHGVWSQNRLISLLQ